MQGYATAGIQPVIPGDLTGALEESEISSTLVSKNVTILGRRTSVRLEPEMWNALKDISRREGCSMHEICSLIFIRKKQAHR
jgi:predicted DNA-binding ribbon-helix-helix protein